MKKKLIYIIVSICLISVIIGLFLEYRKSALVKFETLYADITPTYEKTVTLSMHSLSNLKASNSITLEDGAMLTKISYEDFLSELSLKKDLYQNVQTATRDDELYSYYYYKKEFGLDGSNECEFRAQMEAIFIVNEKSSNAQIKDVLPLKTSLVSGPYKCNWVHSAIYRYPDFNKDISSIDFIKLFGRGYFNIEYDYPFGLFSKRGWSSPTLYMVGSYKTID